MPSRVIRGSINWSRSLARVSLQANLTFRALLVSDGIDDFGRGEADPLVLKATLFPRQQWVGPEQIVEWVDELACEGCVHRYEVDGVPYLQLANWEKHRGNSKRAAASKLPAPPATVPVIPQGPQGKCGSGSVSGSGSCLVFGGSVLVGVQGGATAPAAAQPPETTGAPDLFECPAPQKRRKGRLRKPQTEPPAQLTEEQREKLAAWAAEHEHWAIPRLRELERLCLDHHRARGNAGADWLAAVRNWVTRDRTFREERTKASAGPAKAGRPSLPDWSAEIAAAEEQEACKKTNF